MTRLVAYKLVREIPEEIQEGLVYISDVYRTAIHLCCCGCGEEVVTPFSPTDWQYTINDEGVTLWPSIGNWSYTCRSHYWITSGKVIWAGEMSQAQIDAGRRKRAKRREILLAKNDRGFLGWWNCKLKELWDFLNRRQR